MSRSLRKNTATLWCLSRHKSLPPVKRAALGRAQFKSQSVPLFRTLRDLRGILKYSNSAFKAVARKVVRFGCEMSMKDKEPLNKIVKRIKGKRLRVLRHREETKLEIQYLRDLVDVYDTYAYTPPSGENSQYRLGFAYFTLKALSVFKWRSRI